MKHKLNSISASAIDTKNEIKNFYALTTKFDRENKAFSFDEVIGLFISTLTNKNIQDFDPEQFKKQCLQACAEKMDDPSKIYLIEKKYFTSEKLELDSLLSYQTYKPSNNSEKVFKVFEQLLNRGKINLDFEADSNFLDKIIINELHKHLAEKAPIQNTSSYLPFLSNLFNADLLNLARNRYYFKQNIEQFFELYLFLYSSQLALNIHPIGNVLKVPEAQELYFILNHEKASKERTKVEEKGYKNLRERVKYIFPYLSLLADLSKVAENADLRFYQLKDFLGEDHDAITAIDHYRIQFREARKLPSAEETKSDSLDSAITNLLDSAFEQFKKGNVVNRQRAFAQYISAFERQIAQPFIVNRRRAGIILVMDQDTLLLLTNICIGVQQKVRFQTLMKSFQERGIFFDNKSQMELINLFERIGNIERKSDSGDAVYVKSTI